MTAHPSNIPLRLVIIFGVAVTLLSLYFFLLQGVNPDVTNSEPLVSARDVTGKTTGRHLEPESRTEDLDPLSEALSGIVEDMAGEHVGKEILTPNYLSAIVQGKVMDEEGHRVEKACIRIEPVLTDLKPSLLPRGKIHRRTFSNTSGTFEIPVPGEGAFKLYVDKKGFAPYTNRFVLPGDDLEILLQKGVVLTGLVVEAKTDLPFVKAMVRLNSSTSSLHSPMVETDKEGVFRLEDLPQEKVSLAFFYPGYDLKRLDSVLIREDCENFVKVVLEEGTPLTGVVMERATEKPISNAQVAYVIGFRENGEGREVYREEVSTDAQGSFEFGNVSRRGYRLQVSAEGYSDAILDRFKEINTPQALMKIHLEKVGGITGKILGPDAHPIRGAEIRTYQRGLWGRKESKTVSDASGRFLLTPLAAGATTLITSHPDYGPDILEDLPLQQGETIEGLEIYLTRSSAIHGLVRGPDGSPARNASVVIDGIKPLLTNLYGVYPVTNTDSRGAFRFINLPEGSYRLSAGREKQRSRIEEIVLQCGEELPLTLHLEDGLLLAGTVCDISGIPLDDVLVTSFALEASNDGKPSGSFKRIIEKRIRKTGHTREQEFNRPFSLEQELIRRRQLTRFRGSSRTGADGRFCLSGFLPDDAIMLRFWRYGFSRKMLMDLSPNSGEIRVELAPMYQVQGVVMETTTYTPVPAFYVTLDGEMSPPPPKKSRQLPLQKKADAKERFFRSEDGWFLLENVKPGDYQVRISAKGFQTSKPVPVSVSTDHPDPYVEVYMEKSGTLRGRVQGSDKKPVQGVSVTLRPYQGRNLSSLSSQKKEATLKNQKGGNKNRKSKGPATDEPAKGWIRGRTDTSGRFQFPDLKSASYEILLGNPKKPISKPKVVSVKKGRTTSSAIILKDLGDLELTIQDEGGFFIQPSVTLSGGQGSMVGKAAADSLGKVQFHNLVPGKYKIRVVCPGFKTLSKNLEVKKGDKTQLTFYLSRKSPTK